MASLRDVDLIAILGEDYARKVQKEMQTTPVTIIEREQARQREVNRITDLRISLTGAVLGGLGLLAGPYFLKSGFDVQAMIGTALIAIGVIGWVVTSTRKRSITNPITS